MSQIPSTAVGLPIVVDLDGTLLLGDTLDEGVAALLFEQPSRLIAACLSLLKGRAAFKRAVAASASFDIGLLPSREDLVVWLRARRAQGAALHLVTAADQSIADAAAETFGLFDSATGSTPELNLKGPAKSDYLAGRFPHGFVYCGDSRADIPVFLQAKAVVLCDAPPASQAAVDQAGVPVLARFDTPPASPHDWMKALRIHQWSKNILVFAPLILGHVYMQPAAIARSCAGFLLLSLLASASYLANDMADLDADRRHRSKRLRPFASGRLSLRLGFLISPILTLSAFGAAIALSPSFGLGLAVYFVLTTAYSWKLKHVPLLDVCVIGALFATRIVMGASILGLAQSVWLLSFSMFLFFSLALAKRHVEILAAGAHGAARVRGRGYKAADWPLTLVFGVGSSLASVVIMLLFMNADAFPSGFYRHGAWLFAIPGALTLWVMRIWLLSHRGELHDDPVVFALKDKLSLALALAVAVVFVLAVL